MDCPMDAHLAVWTVSCSVDSLELSLADQLVFVSVAESADYSGYKLVAKMAASLVND